jgi:hypothetical protein
MAGVRGRTSEMVEIEGGEGLDLGAEFSETSLTVKGNAELGGVKLFEFEDVKLSVKEGILVALLLEVLDALDGLLAHGDGAVELLGVLAHLGSVDEMAGLREVREASLELAIEESDGLLELALESGEEVGALINRKDLELTTDGKEGIGVDSSDIAVVIRGSSGRGVEEFELGDRIVEGVDLAEDGAQEELRSGLEELVDGIEIRVEVRGFVAPEEDLVGELRELLEFLRTQGLSSKEELGSLLEEGLVLVVDGLALLEDGLEGGGT